MDNYFLEYSPVQKAFHVSQIKDIIENNLKSLSDGHVVGYCIIAGPGTPQDMYKKRVYFEEEWGRI